MSPPRPSKARKAPALQDRLSSDEQSIDSPPPPRANKSVAKRSPDRLPLQLSKRPRLKPGAYAVNRHSTPFDSGDMATDILRYTLRANQYPFTPSVTPKSRMLVSTSIAAQLAHWEVIITDNNMSTQYDPSALCLQDRGGVNALHKLFTGEEFNTTCRELLRSFRSRRRRGY
jgi:hypothetical protein